MSLNGIARAVGTEHPPSAFDAGMRFRTLLDAP
jgi:hypothetical protein